MSPARVPAIDMVGEFSGSPASWLPSIAFARPKQKELRQKEIRQREILLFRL